MNKTQRVVLSALFAALICAATYIHIPVGSGYIHPADGILIVGAFILGPGFGAASGAIGSALADMFAGYGFYIPATFVIKGLMAVFAALLYKKLPSRFELLKVSASAICAEFIMVLGYLLFELIFYREYALVGALSNLIQAFAGIVVSLLLYIVLSKNKELHKLIK